MSKHRAALQERITQLRMEVSAARQAVSTSGTAAQRAEAHGDKLARELATVQGAVVSSCGWRGVDSCRSLLVVRAWLRCPR